MPKLVLLQGASGTGKTSIANYLRDTFWFKHLEFDKTIDELRYAKGHGCPYGFEIIDILLAAPLVDYIPGFWPYFWENRGKKPHTMETAKELLVSRVEEVKAHKILPLEERFHLGFALWDTYLSERDSELLKENNVVLDSMTSAETRLNNLKLDGLPKNLPVERYVIRLKADNSVNINRKAEQIGWPVEKIDKKVGQNLDLTDLSNLEGVYDLVISPVYDNTAEGKIEEIKQNVRVLLGL